MTPREQRKAERLAQRAEWNKALAEGRVVRFIEPRNPALPYAEVMRMQSYPSPLAAQLAANLGRSAGMDAEVVTLAIN